MIDIVTRRDFLARTSAALSALALPSGFRSAAMLAVADRHLLYVAEPGIRNYVEWGGIGILVFDSIAHFRLVPRIPTLRLAADDIAATVMCNYAASDTSP